jgi:hypothetical protein
MKQKICLFIFRFRYFNVGCSLKLLLFLEWHFDVAVTATGLQLHFTRACMRLTGLA